jgi:Dolichyl-phosphate-mannose-protein mannosyltransferase
LGKTYNDVPLDVVFPLGRVQEIFTFQSGVNCPQIAANIAKQSTHPPLFFCWMHSWLESMIPLGQNWAIKMRSLSALFGVCAIVAMYYLNRLAFSRTSGLMAAFVMAVSPFAVYLSQEARHYTLPMLLIALALLGLMQIQRDILHLARVRFGVWLGWAIINIIGLYVHYFFILALAAQFFTILVLMYWSQAKITNFRQIWLGLILSTCGIAISFLPWLSIILSHFNRSETDWLHSPNHISPIYQTLIGWLVMVISLPVENQVHPLEVVSGFLMIVFGIWVVRKVFQGLKKLWLQPTTHLATLTLLSFSGFVLLEFFAIVYFLHKDITLVPRYNFVYYPSFCALIAASFSSSQKSKVKSQKSIFIFLLVGVISCIFVVDNLAFQKPFLPEKVAQKMNQEPSAPLTLVVGYRDYQDVALGLSFALALNKIRSHKIPPSSSFSSFSRSPLSRSQVEPGNALIDAEPRTSIKQADEKAEPLEFIPMLWMGTRKTRKISPAFEGGLGESDNLAFFKQSPNFSSVWQQLSQLPAPAISKMNLWVVAPGLRRRDYPQQVALSSQMTCNIDFKEHHRIGVPYQLYRCGHFAS